MRSSATGFPASRFRVAYVHSPFCSRRCPYCDFAISLRRDRDAARLFLDALDQELAARAGRASPRAVYVGGGTPSALDPADLAAFLEILSRRLDPSRRVEFSIEMNPEDADPDRAAILAAAGITRVSLGAQSFQGALLARLGRRHRAATIEAAVRTLRDAGIARINLDLIHSVPGQTAADLADDLDRLLALGPDHVSAYSLTFEAGTAFEHARRAGRLEPAGEEVEVAFLRTIRERLVGAGFEHYEVSNFARPGARCLYNLTCWRNLPYLGVGPSAVSHLDGIRGRNAPRLEDWAAAVLAGRSAFVEEERLTPADSWRETVMLALRTARGTRARRLRARFPWGLESVDVAARQALEAAGVLEPGPDRLRPTARGLEVADGLALELWRHAPGAAPTPRRHPSSAGVALP